MPERPDEDRPPSRATALRYEQGGRAPKVTATGRGLIAERILEEAARHDVPVRRDTALVQALAGLEVGHEVPEELWGAVAETLAWAYALDARAARTRPQA